MAISISLLQEHGVLEVTYSADPVTDQDLAEQRRRVADAVSRSNTQKVLVDASALQRFPSPLTELAHHQGVLASGVLRATRFAVVCASLGENERFFEDSGVNRGINLRCFTSREEALSWLGGTLG